MGAGCGVHARPAHRGTPRAPNALQRRKQAQIDAALAWGRVQIEEVSDRDLLIAGTALYAGEGAKRDGVVMFTNTDPRQVAMFCTWLRCTFDIDESRLRVRLYLHQGLDLEDATRFWSAVTGIPREQFTAPYRAVADAGIRHAKHVRGCASVRYSCAAIHRRLMGLVDGLLRTAADHTGSEGGT